MPTVCRDAASTYFRRLHEWDQLIAAAANVPGTLLYQLRKSTAEQKVTFGHPSGTLTVGADAILQDGVWRMNKAIMSRSARRLMKGSVLIPENFTD